VSGGYDHSCSSTGFVADTDAELLIEVTQSDEDVAEIFVQYRVMGTEPWIPEPMKQEGKAQFIGEDNTPDSLGNAGSGILL
jgi:hypothetical protein